MKILNPIFGLFSSNDRNMTDVCCANFSSHAATTENGSIGHLRQLSDRKELALCQMAGSLDWSQPSKQQHTKQQLLLLVPRRPVFVGKRTTTR